MQRYLTIFFAFAALVFLVLFINASSDSKLNYLSFGLVGKEHKAAHGSAITTVQTHAVKLPTRLDFAGEPVPLDDPEVRERLDREVLVNVYWQSSTLLMLKRANRWFPTFEKILKEYGVPEDFKYLALIESGLMEVVSPSGASGYWQFMKATAPQYGLFISNEVDERYHVEKATVAAAKYLLEAKEKLGSWTNAAAGYNAGQAGITNQMTRQAENNYYNLLLNSETSRYVLRILALKLICENPKDFGYHLEENDLYQPYRTKSVKVSGAVHSWVDFSKNNKMTYKELRMLNPWIREPSLVNKEGRTYEVKVWE
jgi:membrane-bound lytic murein transglycosylase D